MVTSSVNTEEDVEPSREDLIESHNDRWQDVRFDYASMDDTYYDMTYPLAKIITPKVADKVTSANNILAMLSLIG